MERMSVFGFKRTYCKGELYRLSNLRAVCRKCNYFKNNNLLRDWLNK